MSTTTIKSSSTENNNNNNIITPQAKTKLHLRIQDSNITNGTTNSTTSGPSSGPIRKISTLRPTMGPTSFPIIISSTLSPQNSGANSTSESSAGVEASVISLRGIIVIGVCAFLIGILFSGLVYIYNQDTWSTTIKRGMRRVSQHLERARTSVKNLMSNLSTTNASTSPPKKESIGKRITLSIDPTIGNSNNNIYSNSVMEKRKSTNSTERRGSSVAEIANSPEKVHSSDIVWTQTKLSITSVNSDHLNTSGQINHGTKILSQFGPNDSSALNRAAGRRGSVRRSSLNATTEKVLPSDIATTSSNSNSSNADNTDSSDLKMVAEEIPTEEETI